MGKILSWIAIGFAIYVAYKVFIALQRKGELSRSRDTKREDGAASQGGPAGNRGLTTLVSCAHCSLQLPKDEALTQGGRYFCGEPHARLGPVADSSANLSTKGGD